MASQITSLTSVYTAVYSGVDQRKHQSSASLVFVRGIQRKRASNAENVSIWWRHHDLTHWRRVTHICVSKLTIIGSDNGLSPGRHQTIIWTSSNLRNKLQWSIKRNSYIFILENGFENVVCEMAAILSRTQCVNSLPSGRWDNIFKRVSYHIEDYVHGQL